MAKNKKEFNIKLYAVVVFFCVAAALILITYTTYTSRYIAFHPEEVAKAYVDTIVQTGDGYNAYKNSLASKSTKYGDFIRKYYMYPIIYKEDGYTPETGKDGLSGYNDDSYKGEKTLNDDGTLQGKVIETMYPYYETLVKENSWDNYDLIYTSYLQKLVEVRKDIFGDEYMTDEIMFTALEANVKTYGEKLTGTEDAFDENTGLQTSFKSEGVYEKLYGENCKFTVAVNAEEDIELSEYLENSDKDTLSTYGVNTDDIAAAKTFTVTVSCGNSEIANITVKVVQIGKSWYVDNTATDTSALYSFYEIG